MDIIPFFKLMVDRGASDLFFSVGTPPHIKVEGITVPVGQAPLKSQQMLEIAASIMSDAQQKEFEATMELNMAISVESIGRYRINLFRSFINYKSLEQTLPLPLGSQARTFGRDSICSNLSY